MIHIRTLRRLLTVCIAFLLPAAAGAQSILIDSLRQELARTDLRPEDRVMTMSQLARALYYKNTKEGVAIARQALALGRPMKDGQYAAYASATLASLYFLQEDITAARTTLDSAVWFAEHTNNRAIKGYVLYRKGRFDFAMEKDAEKCMRTLLKALQLLEGQQAYSHESGVYYYIAGIYSNLQDNAQYDKYVRLSLEAALKGNDPDDICRGYQALGHSFLTRYRADKNNGRLRDSALYYNKLALQVAEKEKGRLIFVDVPAIVALNNANIYYEFFPPSYKDSAYKYVNISLVLAREARYPEVIANCYGILSEYDIREGKFDRAEKMFLMAMSELESDSSSTNLTRARMMAGLSNIAERRGDPAKALKYYKEYNKYLESYFDTEKMAISKRLEAQYQSEKKEQALASLKEQAALNRKLNFFYICLAVASLLALVFLFRSYHFRLKAAQRQQQLLVREKEDAHLQSQLQAAEAKRLELEKQEALLQASLREEEAARLQAEQQLLQERQERLQKELLAGTLQVEEKNELLQTLQKKITAHAESNPLLRQMGRIISENRRMDEDFEALKADFADIHPSFVVNLQEKAQNTLTRLDLKYCSYILMGLSNKEIASRLNVEPKSIRMARYRIKQKLGLQKDDNLDHFIRTLT